MTGRRRGDGEDTETKMGATRAAGSRAGRGLAARSSESAAAVLDFAVTELLRDDTSLGALPEVLARLAALADVRAVLAFQPSVGQPPAVLAMHPAGSLDAALLAEIDERGAAGRGGGGRQPRPGEPRG